MDLVFQLNCVKEKMMKWCERVVAKYGACEFGEPVEEREIAAWEATHGIEIPADYKAWLHFSGTTRLTGIPMVLYAPSQFTIIEDMVAVGEKGDAETKICFVPESGRYVSIRNGKRKNLGHLETILRFWTYDVKNLFAEEDLEALHPVIVEQELKMKQAEVIAKSKPERVKLALEYFFFKNNLSYLKRSRSFPKCPVHPRNLDCGLIISEPDDDGYYQWQPIAQTQRVDFFRVEKELGFSLHPDIKDLVSSYFYFRLDGEIGACSFSIDPILPNFSLESWIKGRFEKESYSGGYDFVANNKFFLLGNGGIDDDDDFLLEVSNDTREVFAVEYMVQQHIKIADSIYDLLMKADPIGI